MKQAKVTYRSRPLRERPRRTNWRRWLRCGIWVVRGCFPLLPFIAVAIIFLQPETPHIRVSYTYRGNYAAGNFVTCQYLGIGGSRYNLMGSDCPFITWLETRINPDLWRTDR